MAVAKAVCLVVSPGYTKGEWLVEQWDFSLEMMTEAELVANWVF
jgi:hypothetical protein